MARNVSCIQELPVEVIQKIFTYLDIQSLENVGQVSQEFKEIIDSSIQIWRHLIKSYCHSQSLLKRNLNYTSYVQSKTCAKSLRKFYQDLVNVQKNFETGKCKKTIIDCQEASLKGRKVEKNPEWSRNHNFKGVYDMTLNEGRICASVYDTIQVWNTKESRLSYMFTNKILDQDNTQTICFTLEKNYLMCGTDNGYLKIIEIGTEKIISKARVNSNCLSDVKCRDDLIITLDWYGNLTFWKLDANLQLYQIQLKNAESYSVPFILRQRDTERLMDANHDHLITTYKSHITVYSFGQEAGLVVSFPVYSDVFCIHLNEDLVAFGCKGSPRHEDAPFIHPVAGIANLKFRPPRVNYIRTPDNDPVISIHLTSSHVILGDINGELHVISIEELKWNEVERITDLGSEPHHLLYTLKSHAYRDFIWALKFDGFRLFSGDETGKIIVHDFLNVEAVKSVEESANNDKDKEVDFTAIGDKEIEDENQSKKPKLDQEPELDNIEATNE
eukprot:TRINITY_DN2116_c0_g1_i2.p1 TRINITY_DN2116_c0_g1~~TRINITY_DN2116_c0_g1_i2.p1  ORF type:complete len:501 (+),score=63.18 TRINITY_DN2116_c0_g1_i2:33-1535(+)